jgi:hypothetical protein
VSEQLEDEIIYQGDGWTIVRSYRAETLVPYSGRERADGTVNHGWIDLRGHPERVAEIPEAERSSGLSQLLRVIADPASQVMSSACDCGAFERVQPGGGLWVASGFVSVMFRDGERNVTPQDLVGLAVYILQGIGHTPDHHIGYDMIIEPLKCFFERTDCHALTVKPLGYGPDETTAWVAFDYAASAAAEAIRRDRPRP